MTTIAAHLRIALTALIIILSALILLAIVWLVVIAVQQIRGVIMFTLLIWTLVAS